MSSEIAIQLSDQAFQLLSATAAAVGRSPAQQAAAIVEQACATQDADAPAVEAETADREFTQCFGSVDLGRSVGIVNADIDADLCREYGGVAHK